MRQQTRLTLAAFNRPYQVNFGKPVNGLKNIVEAQTKKTNSAERNAKLMFLTAPRTVKKIYLNHIQRENENLERLLLEQKRSKWDKPEFPHILELG